MKIRITAGGIYGAEGELPIGSEWEVASVPQGWAERVEVLDDTPADAKPIINPRKAKG